MKNLILFFIALVLIPILDYIWLGHIMKNFYLSELGSLVRMKDGSFQPLLGAAILVYIALSLGIVAFVHPLSLGDPQKAFLLGAVFGFCVYAVYDFTNLSLLQNWPVKMSLVDLAWGTFLCGISAAVVQIAALKISTNV